MSKSKWIEVMSGMLVKLSDISGVTIDNTEPSLTFHGPNGERMLSVGGDPAKIAAAYDHVMSRLGLTKQESMRAVLGKLYTTTVGILNEFSEGQEGREEWKERCAVFDALVATLPYLDQETIAPLAHKLDDFSKRMKIVSGEDQ